MCIEWVCQFCQVLNQHLGDDQCWDYCAERCGEAEERWSEESVWCPACRQYKAEEGEKKEEEEEEGEGEEEEEVEEEGEGEEEEEEGEGEEMGGQ